MLDELWAKTGSGGHYPLSCHLLDAATAMGVLWDKWLRAGLRDLLTEALGPHAREIAMLIAGVHDIGKASPVFALQQAQHPQPKWASKLRERYRGLGYPHLHLSAPQTQSEYLRRHEQIGAAELAVGGELSLRTPVDEIAVAITTLGHHGSFRFDSRSHKKKSHSEVNGGKWAESRWRLIEHLAKACSVSTEALTTPIPPVQTILLSGMVVLADRLASQEHSVKDAQKRIAAGSLNPNAGSNWISERTPFFIGLLDSTLGAYHDMTDPLRAILGLNSPREIQRQALDAGDGLWIVMTATGSGKTEAALLRHSERSEALTFLLPTQATTNAMMRRIRNAFAQTPNVAVLAHGLASLEDFYSRELLVSSGSENLESIDGLYPTEFVRAGSGRLLAPVTVGTIDQALAAALPLKWTHLRLLALANSHVVIDEVHTLEEYQTRLLTGLLKWLGATRTRVTLLSATLTTRHHDQFISAYKRTTYRSGGRVSFPSAEAVSASQAPLEESSIGMDPYVIDIAPVSVADSCQEHVRWAQELLNTCPSARIGIIANTVDRAQAIAKSLQGSGITPIVLHSRMTAKHRQENAEILEKMLGKAGDGEGIVVVGTQAVEASLDIDLDAMSTDLAPAPSLVQRAGRVWRRNDPRRSSRIRGYTNLPLRIVREESDGWHRPYPAAALNRSWNYLKDRRSLAVPADIQDFVETSDLSIEDLKTPEDMEELAEASLRLSQANQVAYDPDEVFSADADLDCFNHLAPHPSQTAGDEYPKTRFLDTDTHRYIPTGQDPESTPGGWSGTSADVHSIEKGDKAQIRRALEGSIPIRYGGKWAAFLDDVSPVETGIGALIGTYAGPLPSGYTYDPLVGLVRGDTYGNV